MDITRQIILLTLYTIMMITAIGISSCLRVATAHSFISTYRLDLIPEYRIWIFILGMLGSLYAVTYPIAFALQPQIARWAISIPLLDNAYGIAVGTIVLLIGYLILVFSMIQLSRSTRPHSTDSTQLVTSGIYSLSRNPVYLSISCLLIGTTLILSSTLYLIAAVLSIINNHLHVLEEEKYLRAAHGPTYEQYRRQVPRYL